MSEFLSLPKSNTIYLKNLVVSAGPLYTMGIYVQLMPSKGQGAKRPGGQGARGLGGQGPEASDSWGPSAAGNEKAKIQTVQK